MINEEKTLEEFGHTSDTLLKSSIENVWAICIECGKDYKIRYKSYLRSTELCRSCPHIGNRNHFYGKKHSDETKKMISENRVYARGEDHQNFGKVLSDETRSKISENHADVSGENNPRFGVTFSVTIET